MMSPRSLRVSGIATNPRTAGDGGESTTSVGEPEGFLQIMRHIDRAIAPSASSG